MCVNSDASFVYFALTVFGRFIEFMDPFAGVHNGGERLLQSLSIV